MGTLYGISCSECGHVSFPARPVCPNCLGSKIVETRVGDRATLLMHTVSHVAPEGFKAPLLQAWVRMEEGPEVFTLLLCSAGDAAMLSTGQRLEFETITDDAGVVKWGYRPVF